MRRDLAIVGLVATALLLASDALSEEHQHRPEKARTSLIIEGGGLLPNNTAVYERLVEVAKVEGHTRIGYLPTASGDPERAAIGIQRFIERLRPYGVSPDDIHVIDLTLANAAQQADNPAVAEQIRSCTLIFFGGGDQTHITRALQPDGRKTAALQAIYEVWKRGGAIAGTSAGAAVQSKTMISASGLPGDPVDEGMDALDFGLTRSIHQPVRRGLLVSPGLGFLSSGIIDQHFSQYRGRLGRLARAAIEEHVRFGFGIDENTALAVATDGTIEVLGPGCVTIVDAAGATCQDSSLGCSITGVHLSCLQQGDRFDPQTGVATVHPAKQPILAGKERNHGNFTVPDIAGRGAVPYALISGLCHNTSRQQIGIALKHNRHYGHGYRYTFSKTPQTCGYEGTVNGLGADAVTHVRLDIEPIALSLRPPETALPPDLPEGSSRKALEAIVFRGILLADEQGRFRPNAPITRGELASAIAHTIYLEPAWEHPPAISDVPPLPHDAEEIAAVVTAGLMELEHGLFRPAEPISRQEAATVLVRLAERYRSETLPALPVDGIAADSVALQHRDAVFAALRAGLLKETDQRLRPRANLTRQEAAEALYIVLGFPW